LRCITLRISNPASVGTVIAKSRPAGNVAVIGEEAFTQDSWDDAFNSGEFIPRSSFLPGVN
jgi:hypothetical protein